MKTFHRLTGLALLVSALAAPLPAAAAPASQGALTVTVEWSATCSEAQFTLHVEGGAPPYDVVMDFGDGETQTAVQEGVEAVLFTHTYGTAGSYAWSAEATRGDLSAQAAGTIDIGPSVAVASDPFPPLLTLSDGTATVSLTAEVTDGTAPFTYAWTLEGASAPDTASQTVIATYSQGGKYTASVMVTDACGLTASDSLAVVVDDPLAEGCHPVAEWLASAINTLYPQQAEQLYTCEDIYAYFTGGLTGSQFGFGIMRHAYMLAQTIPDLTWEEILDWKLDAGGWGLLVQLDRIDEALDEVGIAELIERVASGENSIADIRNAARVAVRYEADFAGVLDLLAGGASPGELTQIYRTAGALGIDPAVVAGYQEMGVRAVELQQAARLAERMGTGWEAVLEAHQAGESWGAIRKGEAESLNNAGNSQGHGQENGQGSEGARGAGIQNEVNERVAAQLASKYGVTIETVQGMLGTCGGDWGCVRTTLRAQFARQGHGRPSK